MMIIPGERIGDECTNDGHKTSDAVEVGESVGSLDQWHVELLGQVCDQIGMESGSGESVTYLICKDKGKGFDPTKLLSLCNIHTFFIFHVLIFWFHLVDVFGVN